jgi:Tfp pilus assembly protein PilV
MKRKTAKALTLIEVMVSILILTIVMLGCSALFITGRKHINTREHYRVALQLASQKLEELKAGSYDDIQEYEPQEHLSIKGVSYYRSTNAKNGGLYKEVQVDVQWTEANKIHNVNLVTFIAPK